MAERLCAHEPCHCEPAPGEAFCGPACAVIARAPQGTFPLGSCECGHPACHPAQVPDDQPPPQAQP